MSAPHCIVCAKPIAKRTLTVYFREPDQQHENGDRVADIYSATIYLAVPPKTKAEAQRHVNGEVVSVSRHADRVYSVGVWDGESYTDRYFHSGECARKQGYASAQHGARFTWGKR